MVKIMECQSKCDRNCTKLRYDHRDEESFLMSFRFIID